METSSASNSNINNITVDKPDELVSPRNAQNTNQNVDNVPQTELQVNQQQKKCLHHRIFDARAGSSMNERVAALTNALIQQVNQQNQSQIIRNPHQQIQLYQQLPNIAHTNSATHFTVGINNSTNNASTSNLNNSPVIHNQNGLVQQMNAALLAERYLLLDSDEGSTLYKCIDVKTHEELVCKVRDYYFLFYPKQNSNNFLY